MQLTFLGKESAGGDSPTLYATDRETYVIQGWIVDDAIVTGLALPDTMTCVEVPPRLFQHLANDGVDVGQAEPRFPVVHVTHSGTFIVRGQRVDEADALAKMRIPDYESCVEIDKATVRALMEEPPSGTDHQRPTG